MITKQMEKALEKHKGLFSESRVTDDIDVVGILLRAGDEKIAWQFVKESDYELPTPNFVWNWFQVDHLCRKRQRPLLSNRISIDGIENDGAVHKPPTG